MLRGRLIKLAETSINYVPYGQHRAIDFCMRVRKFATRRIEFLMRLEPHSFHIFLQLRCKWKHRDTMRSEKRKRLFCWWQILANSYGHIPGTRYQRNRWHCAMIWEWSDEGGKMEVMPPDRTVSLGNEIWKVLLKYVEDTCKMSFWSWHLDRSPWVSLRKPFSISL